MSGMDAPVRAEDRYNYMDVLRGFAVMAIFIVNIKVMVAPYPYYMNPTLWTGDNDMFIASLQAIFVDHKWRTIFTALFGAGLVLIAEKATAAGGDARKRMNRRLLWLLAFGLIHMLAIWYGDILVIYALAGFIALRFADKPAASLVKWAALFLTLACLWIILFTAPIALLPDALLTEIGNEEWGNDPAKLQEEVDIFLGPISGHFVQRAIIGLGYGLANFVFGGIGLLTLGIMLAGMALFKSGFLKGEWSFFAYLLSALLSLGLTFAANYLILQQIDAHDWAFKAALPWVGVQMALGLFGGFGYAALIGLVLKTGLKLSPFAAAGRMAFTNYIASSLIGTTIAYGHAGGHFGALTLEQTMYIVGATFIGMLIWSPLWLAVFRFGPLEWLWRSLTYGKLQPLLK
jgi:uncharacterized protein